MEFSRQPSGCVTPGRSTFSALCPASPKAHLQGLGSWRVSSRYLYTNMGLFLCPHCRHLWSIGDISVSRDALIVPSFPPLVRRPMHLQTVCGGMNGVSKPISSPSENQSPIWYGIKLLVIQPQLSSSTALPHADFDASFHVLHHICKFVSLIPL